MTNDTLFDKIEAWLSGDLPDAEARAFESEMAADPALAAEVERHRRAGKALDRLLEKGLQEDFSRWRESLDELPEPPADEQAAPGGAAPKPPNRLFWLSGLALLLLILAGALWYFGPPARDTETVPPQPREETPNPPNPKVPIANTPPAGPEKQEIPAKKQPEPPASTRPAVNPELVALADIRLESFGESLSLQYGQTMGDEEDENALFAAGLKAFREKNFGVAIKNLLQIKPDDDLYYSAAQELLALSYFKQKNFPAAARCYEEYAKKNPSPAADWRLAQFYLADYARRKADFWRKMDELQRPQTPRRYQDEASRLEEELKSKGITEN